MSSLARAEIREAIKVKVESFYPHDVVKTGRYQPDELQQEYCLINFAAGQYEAEGVQLAATGNVQVSFFKAGVADDEELDVYEAQLYALLLEDPSLGRLVRLCDPAGFNYSSEVDERFVCLSLFFTVFYS